LEFQKGTRTVNPSCSHRALQEVQNGEGVGGEKTERRVVDRPL